MVGSRAATSPTTEKSFDVGIPLHHSGLVHTVPKDRICARLLDDITQCIASRSAADHEARTEALQLGIEVDKGVVQPTATGGSLSPHRTAFLFRSVDEEWDNRPEIASKGGVQGGVIMEAQIATEPDDRR
jgi:hypothetical protein